MGYPMMNKIVLIITHDIELIAGVCTRCIWLEDGQVQDRFILDSDESLRRFRSYRDDRLRITTRPPLPANPERHFDPRIKLVIALFYCTTSTFADPSLVNGMFLSGMLLNLYERKYKSSIGYGVVYAALLFAYLAFPNVVTGLLINVIPRFLVIGEFVSALISNDGGSRTIAALRYMRMPERAIMIFSVIFRFVPVMEKDLSLMKQSIHTRGFFNTVREKIAGFPEYMEILLAPLILRVLRIAESLSASAETRGIALPGRRQSFTSLKVNRSDGALTVLIAALIGFGFFYTRIVALF